MGTPIQDAILLGVTALGLTGSDRVDMNAGLYQLNTTVTTARTFQAPAGNTSPTNLLVNVTGDSGGTSDVRMQRQIITAEGQSPFADVRNRYAGVSLNNTQGRAGLAYTDHSYIWVSNGGTLDTGRVHFGHFVVSGNSAIDAARVYEAGNLVLRDNGRVNVSTGLAVANIGHATAVNQAFGVQIANFSAANLTVGVDVGTTSGPNRWAYRASGDANNAFAGKTRIGSNAVPIATLDVSGDVAATKYTLPGGIGIYAGAGAPTFPAAKGSLYLRSDDNGQHYRNTDGGTGWVQL